MSLFWRAFGLNAAVFVVGTAALAVTPVTVSSPIAVTEALILAVGLSVMLIVNALLLRWALAPLSRLRALMERVDLLRPGARLPASQMGEFAELVDTFNDMLDRLEAERRVSTGRVLRAQEAERQRIARELHDEVGQTLTAVLLQLKRVAGHTAEPGRETLLEAQETVRAGLDDVRRLVHQLRPGVLQDLGLAAALGALATDFAEHARVRLDRRVDADLPSLAEDAELALYRVAQESLTNIARHADAAHVELTLRRTDRGVLLQVADDGRGIDGAEPEVGGIRGMRERALLVGADFGVDRRPDGGTVVHFEVPTPRQDRKK